jgi:hypothetical protein
MRVEGGRMKEERGKRVQGIRIGALRVQRGGGGFNICDIPW